MKLAWGDDRNYTEGVSKGVLYTPNGAYSWSGLKSVQIAPTGNSYARYYEGIRRDSGPASPDLAFTVESFTYPPELDSGDIYGFSYVSLENGKRPQLHIWYNVRFSPSDLDRVTVSDEVDPANFTWEATSTPMYIPDFAPSSHLIIDYAAFTKEWQTQVLEDEIYGSLTRQPKLPEPWMLVPLFAELRDSENLLIIDHRDGRWTAVGPDSMVQMTSDTSFQINSPTVVYLDDDTYQVSSY